MDYPEFVLCAHQVFVCDSCLACQRLPVVLFGGGFSLYRALHVQRNLDLLAVVLAHKLKLSGGRLLHFFV